MSSTKKNNTPSTKLPVEIKGKLQVPVDLAILETLRTEMMGEGLHDQIVEEALRMGVAGCLAGYNQIKLKRELKPPSSDSSSNKKKKDNNTQTKKSRQELMEEEAAKMNPGNTPTKTENDEDGFPTSKNNSDSKDDNDDDDSSSQQHLVARFSNQRFIATVDFQGLQHSIERLMNAFDSMATKLEEGVNGPMAKLMGMKDTLPKEAQVALEELDASLTKAMEEPPAPEGGADLPKSRFDDDDYNESDESENDDEDKEKKNKPKNSSSNNSKKISGVVIEDEEEYSKKYANKGLLAGDDDESDNDDNSEGEDDWKSKDPAAMGYAPLTDDN